MPRRALPRSTDILDSSVSSRALVSKPVDPRQSDLFAPRVRDQDPEARDFIQRLITRMKAHGISLRKGEELWGVDHNTLSKIVNGATEPKLSVYFRMKRWLRRRRADRHN
jgi:hypothetical protein